MRREHDAPKTRRPALDKDVDAVVVACLWRVAGTSRYEYYVPMAAVYVSMAQRALAEAAPEVATPWAMLAMSRELRSLVDWLRAQFPMPAVSNHPFRPPTADEILESLDRVGWASTLATPKDQRSSSS